MQQSLGTAMPEEIELERGPGIAERFFGGWRVIASAWVMAILFVVLFAGVQALASYHRTASHPQSLAGAVIPRHDPNCAGPGAPASAAQNCQSETADLERAETQGYYTW